MAFSASWLVFSMLLCVVSFLQVREAQGRTWTRETPCWNIVNKLKARFGRNPPEDLVAPNCDKDGYFQPLQCRLLTGCNCVDKYGNPTSGTFKWGLLGTSGCLKSVITGLKPMTRTLPRRNTLPTSKTQIQPVKQEPPCWKRVNELKARTGEHPVADLAGPNCDKDGYFEPWQCHPLGRCYCVDKNGNPTSRTSKLGSARKRICPITKPLPKINTLPTTKAQTQPTKQEPPCRKRVKNLMMKFPKRRPADLCFPNCDKDGYFKPLQCCPLRRCLCVDEYGIILHSYKMGSVVPKGCPTFLGNISRGK